MILPTDAETASNEIDLVAKRDTKRGRKVLLGFAAVVLAAGLAGGFYVFNLVQTLGSGVTKIESAFPDESTRPRKTNAVNGVAPVNLLIMGSDTRGTGQPDVETDTAANQRADALMLVHIPADRKHIYVISLMRDLWVSIPGKGEAKINAALAYGGVPLMIQTVETLFQQRIDHVAIVDFEGFKGLTDAVGGVDINVKVPFASSSGHQFAAGKNTLNGSEALTFVRERYAFNDGDHQRVRNQQEYLKSMIGKMMARETLTNPITVNNMATAISPFVSLDKGLDFATLGSLALSLKEIRLHDTVMFTLPTAGNGVSSDGQSIVIADTNAISELADALSEDNLSTYVTTNSLEKGN